MDTNWIKPISSKSTSFVTLRSKFLIIIANFPKLDGITPTIYLCLGFILVCFARYANIPDQWEPPTKIEFKEMVSES